MRLPPLYRSLGLLALSAMACKTAECRTITQALPSPHETSKVKTSTPADTQNTTSGTETTTWSTQSARRIHCPAAPHSLNKSCQMTKKSEDQLALADALGWVIDPNSPNLCPGYYQEPLLVMEDQDLHEVKDVRISADVSSIHIGGGYSQLSGNVVVEQPGRRLHADKVQFFRNATTGEVTELTLDGNISLREEGKLMVGKHAFLDLEHNSGYLDDTQYRLSLNNESSIIDGLRQLHGINGRGSAERINVYDENNFDILNANYSNCPPLDSSWQIVAKKITFNRTTGRARARDASLHIMDIPVFYAPILDFPFDDKRHSGMLMPIIQTTNNNGFDVALPYYLNIAPNADATVYPRYVTKRGTMFGGEFRYMDEHSDLNIRGDYLPHDHDYAIFKAQNGLTNLDGSHRNALSINDVTQINPYLTAEIHYNTVSDDYYFIDFHHNLIDANDNQLLQLARLQYHDDHWLAYIQAQHYQTLHPQTISPVMDVYSRYPEIGIFGDYPDQFLHTHWTLRGNFNHFVWPDPTIVQNPNGQRTIINPAVQLPLGTEAAYIAPTFSWHYGYYDLHNGLVDHDDVSIPMLNVDSGLRFERALVSQNTVLTQTLEPRAFYTYAPYVEQDQLPLFDTALATFHYDQLFNNNRFIGDDRVNDANQVSLGLSSAIYNDNSGLELVRASIGQIFYFQDRRVQLCTGYDCQESPLAVNYISPTATTSPIVGQLRFHLYQDWFLNADVSWDPQLNQMNTAYANLHYEPMENQILDFNYSFIQNGDVIQQNGDVTNHNLQQVGVATAWSLNQHWHTLGALRYNLDRQFTHTYFAGIEYDSCCWAVRLMGGRVFTVLTTTDRPQYDTVFYLQFLLKGFTAISPYNPSRLLGEFIPGYHDYFN